MADKDKDKPVDENKIDHYVKQGHIASGKHAQVIEVQEENTSNRFALKVLLPEAMLDPEQVAILKYEGKVAQSLEHPNIIKWYATVVRKTNVYLVLELFKALNVKNFIANDSLGVHTRLRKLIDSLALALQHMHEKGWLHLDVKPDNVLLNRSSEVRLIDFSLSQRIKSGLGKMFSGKKEAGGTLTYVAPETIRKDLLTPQTDIYSFGILIFECLTGTFPFKGSTPKDLLMKHLSAAPAPPSDFNKNVTPEMDRMILRMLAKKPKDRQKNMQELMSEFRNIQIFKEDPEKLAEQKMAEAKEAATQQSLGKRLDSRTDAARREAIKANPELAKELAAAKPAPPPKLPEPAKPAAKKPMPAPPQPVSARPPMPMMPQPMAGFPQPMPFPQMPGMPMMPGQFQPMPGQFQPMPQMQIPSYPGMPAQMPGYPGGMPGVPGAPMIPGQMPGAYPGMLAIPGQPVQPPNPQTRPAPARPVRLERPVAPAPPKDGGDLPTMDELPDVL